MTRTTTRTQTDDTIAAFDACRQLNLTGLAPELDDLCAVAVKQRLTYPAFLAGEEPRKYLCMYPYARSLEWYLLEPEERRAMLAEHGIMGRDYPDVRANTVSSFALGDYEWLLAFECDELERIVDVMRHLRSARARAHTREELPFLTGIRKPLPEIAAALG